MNPLEQYYRDIVTQDEYDLNLGNVPPSMIVEVRLELRDAKRRLALIETMPPHITADSETLLFA